MTTSELASLRARLEEIEAPKAARTSRMGKG
jgi:hypothetical protein